jgi:hypothetical protein
LKPGQYKFKVGDVVMVLVDRYYGNNQGLHKGSVTRIVSVGTSHYNNPYVLEGTNGISNGWSVRQLKRIVPYKELF